MDRKHRPKRNRDALSFLRNIVQARVLCCIIHRDYRVKDVIRQLLFQFG